MSRHKYEQQGRGDATSYERYLRGMNQSMRQKVALTAAHLLGRGTVADMGMGSGAGTLALAALYPEMKIVGIDVNPEMVARARQTHVLPNLEFRVGDIAEQVCASGSLDAIFNSSVLHHVTSFNGYDHTAAASALAKQAEQLALGGSLIVRDFLAPDPSLVVLALPADDGDESDDPRLCSSARLFERFAREFRSLSDSPGFEYHHLASDPAGDDPTEDDPGADWKRYRVDARLAAEFLLRKNYRSDWQSEVMEEYTYFTQAQFEATFARLGLRLLASFPIHNPWIVKHRFEGHCTIQSLEGEALEYPATNYLIVGEKVSLAEGVRFEAGEEVPSVGFLIEHCFENRASGERRDLVRRAGTTLDVVPWFQHQDAVYILARKGRPRPVLQTLAADEAIDGGAPVGYVTEPILAIQTDKPLGLTVENALRDAAVIEHDDVRSLVEVGRYYPSPGGLVEEVRAVHVEIAGRFVENQVHNATGFSTGGTVRAIDARQLLRAAQVGALPDARLEVNVYEFLLKRGWDVGPWIGARLELEDDDGGPGGDFLDCHLRPRRVFEEVSPERSSGFLRRVCRQFTELNARGEVLARQALEYVIPNHLSCNTIVCAVLRQHQGTALIGIDEDDLPAAQCFSGSSAMWVAPAWRLPKNCASRTAAHAWVKEQLERSYGVRVTGKWELGGRFHPSAGVTPEIVFPLAFRVRVAGPATASRNLRWVKLADLAADIDHLRDGHLRLAALRAAHALGVL